MSILKSTNPATGAEIQKYKEYSDTKVKSIIKEAKISQMHWSKSELDLRLVCLKEIMEVLSDRKRELSLLITDEMGKPLNQSDAEIEKCISLCNYYFENSSKFLEDRVISEGCQKSLVTFQPIGLVLGIMPWNFPFWQVFRFAIPTITAGNGAILKHASNVQGSAFAIEACFQDAGYPKNIFRNISISSKKVKKIIKNIDIAAITLTGSTPAGKAVGKIAGKFLKKTVLELGGSDPYIILDDADLNKAVQACISGRILNNGQSCISAKRIISTKKLYPKIVEKIKLELSKKIMGDPKDKVDIGPMVSYKSREQIHDQVSRTIKQGATLLMGGFIPDIIGAYYPITLLTDVEPGMIAFDEEIFGPVFSCIMAEDEAHAIELGNSTNFGLGSAIFTENQKRAKDIAKNHMQAGVCFVNDFVKSDPKLPFGGIKQSGYGRELSSYGMMEFVNVKTVVMNYE